LVYLRRTADQPQAGKALLMVYQAWERREASFPVEAYHVCSGETVGDPSADLPPENRHWIHNERRGGPDYGPVQEDRGQERAS